MNRIFFIIICTAISFTTISCNLLNKNRLILIYFDKEKYSVLLERGNRITEEEFFDIYIEFQIEDVYWNDIIRIINSSRYRIWVNSPFGPRYGTPQPTYAIKMYFINNKVGTIEIWDGYYQFNGIHGWYIIKENNRENFMVFFLK